MIPEINIINLRAHLEGISDLIKDRNSYLIDKDGESIRKTTEEIMKSGYELLQHLPEIYIKKAGSKNHFDIIWRCENCGSLILCGTQILNPNMTWTSPKCGAYGESCL